MGMIYGVKSAGDFAGLSPTVDDISQSVVDIHKLSRHSIPSESLLLLLMITSAHCCVFAVQTDFSFVVTAVLGSQLTWIYCIQSTVYSYCVRSIVRTDGRSLRFFGRREPGYPGTTLAPYKLVVYQVEAVDRSKD